MTFFQAVAQQVDSTGAPVEKMKSPLEQVFSSDWVIVGVFLLLVSMAVMSLLIMLLKVIQMLRMRGELHRFERESFNAVDSGELFEVARRNQSSPGGRVVLAIAKRGGSQGILEAVAKRAIVTEQQRAGGLLPVLGSVAAAAPFVGLLGTVYGIMKAFMALGENSGGATLKVVAPAIGEALVTTLMGLVAAIPALVAYNLLNRWVDSFLNELDAASGAWVTIIADSDKHGGRAGAPTLANPHSGSQQPPRPSFPTY